MKIPPATKQVRGFIKMAMRGQTLPLALFMNGNYDILWNWKVGLTMKIEIFKALKRMGLK